MMFMVMIDHGYNSATKSGPLRSIQSWNHMHAENFLFWRSHFGIHKSCSYYGARCTANISAVFKVLRLGRPTGPSKGLSNIFQWEITWAKSHVLTVQLRFWLPHVSGRVEKRKTAGVFWYISQVQLKKPSHSLVTNKNHKDWPLPQAVATRCQHMIMPKW